MRLSFTLKGLQEASVKIPVLLPSLVEKRSRFFR